MELIILRHVYIRNEVQPLILIFHSIFIYLIILQVH